MWNVSDDDRRWLARAFAIGFAIMFALSFGPDVLARFF